MKKFQMPRVIERSYARAIDRLLQGLKRELIHVASPFFIADVLRRLARSPTFRKDCERIARTMATHLFRDGHKTWRAAAAEGSNLLHTAYRVAKEKVEAATSKEEIEAVEM